jgi:hypothetical protein
MARRRIGRSVIALAGVAVLAMAGNAVAAKPTVENIVVDDSFQDDELAAACGLDPGDVTTVATGHIKIRTWGEDSPNASVTSINVMLTATGPGGSYRFHDVGADRARIADNGDVIVLVTGQVPFDFTGSIVVNETTGEILRPAHHDTSGRLDAACAALT